MIAENQTDNVMPQSEQAIRLIVSAAALLKRVLEYTKRVNPVAYLNAM